MTMYANPVRQVMSAARRLVAPPSTRVIEAVRLMAERQAGAVLVIDGDRLLGIFTERDAVFRVMAAGRDPNVTTLADVMTPSPITIAPDKPFGSALALMHKHGFRHLPVVDGERVLGIVSARNALDPDLEEFVAEAQRRTHFAADT
jgi:CBS domain-containing protein